MTRIAFVIAMVLVLGAPMNSARADTLLLEQTATCTGRLSAYLELHWARDDPRASDIAKLHSHMTDLMFALITEQTDRASRALRAEAKTSFQSLLATAGSAAPASRLARLAATKARHDLRTCTALIVAGGQIDSALGFDAGPGLPGVSG